MQNGFMLAKKVSLLGTIQQQKLRTLCVSMGTRCGVCCYLFLGLTFLIQIGSTAGQKEDMASTDGFKNNLNQATWGIAGSNLLRVSSQAYSDGAYEMAGQMRPNPLEISLKVHSTPDGSASRYSRNALQAYYAQLVLDEIAQTYMSTCPPEYENMDLPSGHPLRQSTTNSQVFLRSLYDQSTGYTSAGPRQQINLVSSFMDGGLIYGSTNVWTTLLRSYKEGKLLADSDDIKSSFPVYNAVKLPVFNAPIPRDHVMKPVDRLFRIGNAKGHENPFLLALQVVWFRWHNVIADNLARTSNYTDEEIFHLTKRKVVGTFQKVAFKEWLPAFLNGNASASSGDYLYISNYTQYDSRTQPGITQEFLAAMEFRNTITPSAVWALGDSCAKSETKGRGPNGEERTVPSFRLCNNFWDSQEIVRTSFNEIIRGMIYTRGKKEDGLFVSDFTAIRNSDITEFNIKLLSAQLNSSKSFYGPFEYSRTDLVATQIQRFRDHGLQGLNAIRKAYGLSPLNNWDRLGGANGTINQLYGGQAPDDVDLITGGLLDTLKTNGISDLFIEILKEQFIRVRDTDRFWYENNKVFDIQEINEIDAITFKMILQETTNISSTEFPEQVFLCSSGNGCACQDPPSMDNTSSPDVDVCSPLSTHDYISGSQVSFALSWLAIFLVIPVSIGVLCCMVKKKKVGKTEYNKRKSTLYSRNDRTKFAAREYLGPSSGFRDIKGELKSGEQRIIIRDSHGKDLRYVDFKTLGATNVDIFVASDKESRDVCLKVPGDIDLILKFADITIRQNFLACLDNFFRDFGQFLVCKEITETALYNRAVDKDHRQKLLDNFFRVICLTVFEGSGQSENDLIDLNLVDEVIHIKLTMTEFADALGMQPSSLFVKNVFLLADKDNQRFLSFEEFLNLFGVFLKGTAEQKSQLLFKIYDVHKVGYLTKEEFHRMIKSLLDLAESSDLTNDAVKDLISSMYRHVGLIDADKITYDHFKKIFCSNEYSSTLQKAMILGTASKHAPVSAKMRDTETRNRRHTFIKSYISTGNEKSLASYSMNDSTSHASLTQTRSASFRVSVQRMEYPGTVMGKKWHSVTRYFDTYRLQIFWCILYTLVTIGIFVERAVFFARGREHAGLRRMSGAWITAMIRGSASVIMFTYSSLLVTMCRNTITALRETFLHRYIPFDSAVAFHKYISVLAMIGTILHVATHGMNLYCMCTQSTTSINCFFREYYTDSYSIATFHFWAFQTITGLAGVLVTVLIFIMYVFATQFSRRHVFKAFWFTHSLYWLVYILTFLHGIGRLVQAPLFAWYLIGPLILFVVDQLQSISRNKVEITVKAATPLPSGVLRLVFRRPTTFNYKSGQWVRIACPELSKSEYHPFTLTSAPNEPFLSLHIRAVGPWTTNLRRIYSSHPNEEKPPTLFLDGPFGEGHQDWYSCEVAVLVGGGIGVTPFASILKDIAFKSKSGIPLTCKKVYFLWVTRTQHSFEWLVDIIRDVEAADVRGIVDTHIFVTQFQQQYDLRTTMLYICERYFQKVEGKSLFTGLKAVTHFGRPHFEDFFMALSAVHKGVSQVGVFSCGPGPMTGNVQKACNFMNSCIGPTFTHHFENF